MGTPWSTSGVVNYRVDFAGDFPDHLFIVYRHIRLHRQVGNEWEPYAIDANDAEYVDPAAGPMRIARPPATSFPVSFLIVPRAAGAGLSALELGRAVLAGRVPGAVRHDLPVTAEWPQWRLSRPVISYRVRPASGGEPEFVQSSWDPMSECWVVGIGLPAATVLAGFWWLRRRRRLKPSAE
jgi:hypothetical protein